MPHRRTAKWRTIDRTIKASAKLIRLWGRGMIGFVLVRAFYSESPWVSAAEVGREAGVSEDTAKRKLDELVGAGRALTYQHGTGTRYSAPAKLAEETYAAILSVLAD